MSIQVDDDDHELKGGLLKNQAPTGPTEEEIAEVERILEKEKGHG